MVETGTSHFSRFESSVCCLRSPYRILRKHSYFCSVLVNIQIIVTFVERCQSWEKIVYCLLFTISWWGPHTETAGFCFWRLKLVHMGTFTKKMSILCQFTVLIVHLLKKMWLFTREVRFQIHSVSGVAGSKMIYSGSDSGSGSDKKFRIRPDPDLQYNTGYQYRYLCVWIYQ